MIYGLSLWVIEVAVMLTRPRGWLHGISGS